MTTEEVTEEISIHGLCVVIRDSGNARFKRIIMHIMHVMYENVQNVQIVLKNLLYFSFIIINILFCV